MQAALTTTTFDQAVRRQRPLAGLVHHSDRGSQYAATTFQERLGACRVTASMSRKGNPYDNALAESFVATLKTKCFGGVIPSTRDDARLMVFDYPETFITAAADTAASATAHRSTAKNKCSPQTKTTNLNT